MSIHDEEVLGKAYDAVLMRRLLRYLWPYRLQVAVALASIICASVLQLAQPYLMKVAIDRHIATGDLRGLETIAVGFLAILLASFALDRSLSRSGSASRLLSMDAVRGFATRMHRNAHES